MSNFNLAFAQIWSKVSFDKYLGDIVSGDSLNKRNIEAKTSKGMGIINQIMILLEEICLGQYYCETAVLLRESMFVNGILFNFNIEACYGLTKEDINALEILNRVLMRKILSAHSKTPVEAMYLELGCIPLEFIIKSRRLNFLHYILTRKENDLLKNFFKVQSKYPVKNDWVHTVKEALRELKINLNFDEIQEQSKFSFSNLVKKQTIKAAFNYLIQLKNEHSKLANLNYTKLQMQSYLKFKSINKSNSTHIFKFRTRMAQVKNNFPSQFTNKLECPECKENATLNSIDIADDTQEHLIYHSATYKKSEFRELSEQDAYLKLFSGTDEEKLNIMKILEEVITNRIDFTM